MTKTLYTLTDFTQFQFVGRETVYESLGNGWYAVAGEIGIAWTQDQEVILVEKKTEKEGET